MRMEPTAVDAVVPDWVAEEMQDLRLSQYEPEQINSKLRDILSLNPVNGPDSIRLISNDGNLEFHVESKT